MPDYTFRDRVNRMTFGIDPAREDRQTWWTMRNGKVELLPPDEPRVEWTRRDEEMNWDLHPIGRALEPTVEQVFAEGFPTGTTTTTANTYCWSVGFEHNPTLVWEPVLSEPNLGSIEIEWRRNEDRDKAHKKSKSLLLSYLSPEQKEELERCGYFTVVCPSKNTYRIDGLWVYRINGNSKTSYCIQPEKPVPIYDRMLCQMLILETNEDEFLRIANEMGSSWITSLHRN